MRATPHRLVPVLLCISTSLAACSDAALAPPARAPAALPAAIARLAYTVEISTATAGQRESPSEQPSGFGAGARSPVSAASLLGADAIAIETARIERSIVGRFQPGKVRLSFDLRVRNVLRGTDMIPPTFPAPPALDAGIFLFSAQSVAIEAPGGVSTSGNTVRVSPPEGGTVTASIDWDGAPYDYVAASFASCNARSATCARFERFAAPLRSGGLSEWRRVGYDIDPTVRHIRLRLVLAADLVNSR